MTREIKKIKYADKVMEIEYTETNGAIEEERKLRCTDPPVQEFGEVLQSLKSFVVKVCELDEKYADTMRVQSISYSWKQGIMGATVTVLKKLLETNAPLVINTPFLPSVPYGRGETPTLPSAAVDKLKLMIVLAEKYLDGERLQKELEFNS